MKLDSDIALKWSAGMSSGVGTFTQGVKIMFLAGKRADVESKQRLDSPT